MDKDAFLAFFDQDRRRRDLKIAGSTREETPYVIRHIWDDQDAFIGFSQLTSENADEVIAGEIAYFDRLGHSFEWKYYQHDSPPDLNERLSAHGLVADEWEAFVAMDLHNPPEALLQPVTLDVRRITDPELVRDVIAVEQVVWQKDYTEMGKRLADDLRQQADEFCLYIAYEEDRPVSCAWIYFVANSQFAGLWGGSTLPDYRKKGYYTALLSIRLQEAVRRGIRYLTVDASPMSRPILEKHGFQFMEYTIPYNWTHKKPE